MTLPKNPIFQRLTIRSQAVSARRLAFYCTMITVIMVGLSLWLATTNQLASNRRTVTLIAAIVATLLLTIVSTTGAVLTVNASRGEAFQLLRLTNFPSNRVVWAYVGATLHRTRLYWWAFVWVFPLSMLPILMDVYDYANRVPSDTAATLTTPARSHPMEVELLVFWAIGVVAALGFSFLTVSGTVTAALKRRAIVRGTLSPILNTLTTILLGSFLLLITISTTHNVLYIFFSAYLACVPYMIGLLFCRWRRTNPVVLITNTIYVPLLIFLVLFVALLYSVENSKAVSPLWYVGITIIGLELVFYMVIDW
jgi:hypothetical protein